MCFSLKFTSRHCIKCFPMTFDYILEVRLQMFPKEFTLGFFYSLSFYVLGYFICLYDHILDFVKILERN